MCSETVLPEAAMPDEMTLTDRVRAFEMLELPGQPEMMHMGTSYLVGDLWREVRRLDAALSMTLADCGILLAQIDHLTAATGETLDTEDAALVEQIRATLARPSNPHSPKDNQMTKTLHNSDDSGTRVNVKDVNIVGNVDMFQLLCKASSAAEGWMKSTKAMQVVGGCVVQVTTQQRNADYSYSVAEALAYVPGAQIVDDVNGGRKLAPLS
jgi:hypothetical protein